VESWFDSQHRLQFLLSEPSGYVLGLTPSSNKRTPATLSQRIKQPGCKAYHLSLSSVEIKNVWSYTFTPSTCIYVAQKKYFTFNYTASRPT
jgi:hypothetical protein